MIRSMSFEGKWVLDKSENFDEYMKEVGVNILVRKAAAHIKVQLEIKKEGDKWVCFQTSTFKNTKLEFKLDEEFEETTPDGRTVKSLIKMVSGKLVHTQTPIKYAMSEDKPSVITRWIENDRLITTLESGGVICRREYVRERPLCHTAAVLCIQLTAKNPHHFVKL
ncbi:lipocalin / cytosolic fatty-acid binding protein [Dictyocaulus viviparus]|uniref:Lipocalin / cytosolic fatty-acid binding protein n=1 Tax=Dictyocaulus viviparus TaxID=29172 RepID=A0A0D8XV25_DICVI|nr:lipocalin / cytosolic fatty-acid binding protein [Dictyocaulus viviparus]